MLKYEDDPGIDFDNYSLDELVNETYKESYPIGYQVVVRIYKPPVITKTTGGLFLSDESIAKNNQDYKFVNFVGLVVKMAPGCYLDTERYKFTGPYCKVGDWVMFPRPSAHTYAHKGITSATIWEDRLLQRVDDPRVITRISCD